MLMNFLQPILPCENMLEKVVLSPNHKLYKKRVFLLKIFPPSRQKSEKIEGLSRSNLPVLNNWPLFKFAEKRHHIHV